MISNNVRNTKVMTLSSKALKAIFFLAGLFFTGLGIIGAILPVMPTTVFLIVAVYCFGRSSPRFESWLLNHSHFGPTLRNWQQYGAISRRIKCIACIGMALGFTIFYFSTSPAWPLTTVVALFMLFSAWYVFSRPVAKELEKHKANRSEK